MPRRNHRIPKKSANASPGHASGAKSVGRGHDPLERRAHQRYRLKKGAFAMLQARSSGLGDISGMSMGQIGMAVLKSHPLKMGEIKNVSRSGLLFHYPAGCRSELSARKIDIVLAENAICLKGLDFITIADTEVDEGRPFAPIKTNQQQIQFINLTASQSAMLDRLIKTHADQAPKGAEGRSPARRPSGKSVQPVSPEPPHPPIGGANGEA
jgi:hypothetical protein